MACSGLLASLEESSPTLQAHGLVSLLKVVDEHWAEVASSLPLLEALAEEAPSPRSRSLASLLSAKVLFHLGSHGEALARALASGPLFDVADDSEFVTTLLGARSRLPSACVGARAAVVADAPAPSRSQGDRQLRGAAVGGARRPAGRARPAPGGGCGADV